MSALSEVELARIVKQGNEEVKAFGSNLSDDDAWAVAAYLRTLALASPPLAQATPFDQTQDTLAPVTQTPIASDAGMLTQSAEGTPVGTEQVQVTREATAIPQPGFGIVNGSIENNTGAELSASDLKVTLRAFEHGSDPNAAPQEVLTLDGAVGADGSFTFENVEMPKGRIFIAEILHEGITLQSDFASAEEGASTLDLKPITLYGTSNDTSALVMDEARLFFEYGDTKIQVFGVYSFRNPTDKMIIVELKDGAEIPFISPPEGAQALGYELLQDSARFVNTDKGLAMPPSETSYGLITFSTLPKDSVVEVSQSFPLPVADLVIFLPEGVKAESARLTDHGMQVIENFNFQMYAAGGLGAGDTLTFTLSGAPGDAAAAPSIPETNTNQNLVFAAGALGIAFIVAGGWMLRRDRNPVESGDEESAGNDFESPEDVMDAIIALDDLHRGKKISEQAYQKRRGELKEILKELV